MHISRPPATRPRQHLKQQLLKLLDCRAEGADPPDLSCLELSAAASCSTGGALGIRWQSTPLGNNPAKAQATQSLISELTTNV